MAIAGVAIVSAGVKIALALILVAQGMSLAACGKTAPYNKKRLEAKYRVAEHAVCHRRGGCLGVLTLISFGQVHSKRYEPTIKELEGEIERLLASIESEGRKQRAHSATPETSHRQRRTKTQTTGGAQIEGGFNIVKRRSPNVAGAEPIETG